MNRFNITSGTDWEHHFGYSRAVRMGNIIKVSGTTSIDDNGTILGIGNVYEQAVFIFEKINRTLHQAGASMNDVVQVRMYVTDISQWEEVGRAFSEFLKDVGPVATIVEVSSLIEEELLVEIEVEAITP